MDPFLLCLILCCIAGVFLHFDAITDGLSWDFLGLALLAVVAVIVLTTAQL